MLVLTRKSNQSIMLNDDVEITVLSVVGEKVRVGISAPKDVQILRKELFLETDGAPAAAPTDASRDRPRHAGEQHAAAYLERRGFRIIARSHRTRFGELDLVAYDGRTIAFAEVRTRRAGTGSPWEALGAAKCRQVRRMASAWLADTPDRPRAAQIRFDAIGVVIDRQDRLVRLDHLEAAF